MRTLTMSLTFLWVIAFPLQLMAREDWSAGYDAGGIFSEVDGSGGTSLAIYCNPWIDAHPAGLLITLPAAVTDAEDKTYEIAFSFADREMSFIMLLTQGRALQFSARGAEKFSALEELVALIKASDGFAAHAQELGWTDEFSSEHARRAIGDLLECEIDLD